MSREMLKRLQRLERDRDSSTKDPRWPLGAPLFILYQGEDLVTNPVPGLEPLIIRCPRLRTDNAPHRFSTMPEHYLPFVKVTA